MTNRQQSAFFLVIVFLFTTGIGLVIYRQYDLYYQQKTATDLETASTVVVPAKELPASATPEQISGWKIYKNTKYGFEFQYPNDSYINYDSTLNSSIEMQPEPEVALNSHSYNINWTVSLFKPFDWYKDPRNPSISITLDGIVCQSTKGQYQLVVVMCHNGSYDYEISYGSPRRNPVNAKSTDFYNIMLSTFKFTN